MSGAGLGTAAAPAQAPRASGATRGLLVGVVGAVLWLAAGFEGLGQDVWRLLWANPDAMSNMELEVLFVFFFGPMAGLVFSIVVGGVAERAIRDRRATTGLYAGAIAAGVYALALGALYAAVRFGLPGPGMLVVWPLIMTGLRFVGPLPLLVWALLAGGMHGVARPRAVAKGAPSQA